MLNRFFKNYGKKKLMDGMNSLNDAIVKFDPVGATEAAIDEMEENFDEINKQYSSAKTVWQKENDEAVAIVKVRDQRMAAAESIAAQLEADPDNADIEAGLNQLLEALEDMQSDIDLEVEEADDAKEMMDELGATVKMYGDKLKNARTDMRKAANNMKKAQLQEERAEAKAARVAEMAGLKSAGGGLSSALESMNRQANDAKENADAAKRKADMLGSSSVEENDVVKAAMAAASGAAPAPVSAKDRLAALRK